MKYHNSTNYTKHTTMSKILKIPEIETPLTVEFLDYCLQNDIRIDLKYPKHNFHKDTLKTLHEMYYRGDLYLAKYAEVFGLTQGGLLGALKRVGPTLNRKQSIEFYGDQIKAKYKDTMLKEYGVDNAGKSAELRDKAKQTNLQLYGIEHASQSEIVKERMYDTNIRKYGVKIPTQNKEIRDKIDATIKEKYGADSIFASQDFKIKRGLALMQKYPNGIIPVTPEIIEKRKQTSIRLYGVDSPMKSSEIAMRNKASKIKSGRTPNSPDVVYAAQLTKARNDPRYAKTLDIQERRSHYSDADIMEHCRQYSQSAMYVYLHRFGLLEPYMSAVERILVERLKDVIEGEIVIHFRGDDNFDTTPILTDGNCREFDVMLPEFRIVIEVDGLYYHNKDKKEKFYHLDKRLIAAKNGFHLINFTDVDVTEDPDKCIERILSEIEDIPDFNKLKNLKVEDFKVTLRTQNGFEYWDSGTLLTQ